jgi:hypothetical protein
VTCGTEICDTPGPNFWNETDCLRGIAHTVPVQTYAEGSRCQTPSQIPSQSQSPVPGSWHKPSMNIPSNKEEEEASVPMSPSHEAEDEYSSGNADESSENLEIVPVHGGALACSVCPLGSPQLPCSADALIAVGPDSVYAERKHLDLNQVFELAFSVVAAKHSSELVEPKLFKQAMAGPDSDKWYEVCMVEMQAVTPDSSG